MKNHAHPQPQWGGDCGPEFRTFAGVDSRVHPDETAMGPLQFCGELRYPYGKARSRPRIVEEAVNSAPNTRFDRAHFREYGEFGLIFEVVFFVQSPGYKEMMDARQAFNMELKRRLEKEGISFAFPAGFTCAGRRRA